jgi:hypothetical protein
MSLFGNQINLISNCSPKNMIDLCILGDVYDDYTAAPAQGRWNLPLKKTPGGWKQLQMGVAIRCPLLRTEKLGLSR